MTSGRYEPERRTAHIGGRTRAVRHSWVVWDNVHRRVLCFCRTRRAFAAELARHYAQLLAIARTLDSDSDPTLTRHVLEAVQRTARQQRQFATDCGADDA